MNSTIDTDEALAVFVAGKTVSVEEVDHDRYGRVVANVRVAGRLVNAEMVLVGLAWRYVQFDRCNEFGGLEDDAQRDRRGLWDDAVLIGPWEWRKTEKERKTARKAAGVGR